MTTKRPIMVIATEIEAIWSKQGKGVNYAAKPYLDAMHRLNPIKDSVGYDDGRDVVLRFLGNATSFRGDDARRLKAELRDILG